MTLALPVWSVVTPKRVEHIARVVHVLEEWAVAMDVDADEAKGWRDAGRWHDALRDEREYTLRMITGELDRPVGMLHGPAAASRLAAEGESRLAVLEAIRWHTVGLSTWQRTGRALYMADFLEPGRRFLETERAAMRARVPVAFDEVFRDVVRLRIEWALRSGKGLAPESVTLWNAVR